MPDDLGYVFWTPDFVWSEDYVVVELDPVKMPPGSFTHGPLPDDVLDGPDA